MVGLVLRDLYHSTDVVESIAPEVLTADEDGASADMALHSAALVIFNFGVSGDTLSGTTYLAGVIQESDDNVTFTDVADDDLLGSEPTVDDPSEDGAVHHVGYIGDKRYIRARLDFTGTHTNGIPASATIVRAFPRYGHAEAV